MSGERLSDDLFNLRIRQALLGVLYPTDQDELLREIDRMRRAELDWAVEALAAMAGLVGTPEDGYLEDGGPTRFREDAYELRRLVQAQHEALALKDTEITELREVLRQHEERGDDA